MENSPELISRPPQRHISRPSLGTSAMVTPASAPPPPSTAILHFRKMLYLQAHDPEFSFF